MKKLIVILCVITGTASFSQNQQIHDSLMSELQKYDARKSEFNLPAVAKGDTVKADLLWELYQAGFGYAIDTAEGHVKDLMALSEQLQYKKGLGNAYSGMGSVSWLKGDFAQSLEYHKLSLKYRTEAGYKKGIAASYNSFGVVYTSLGNYPEALKNLMISVEKADEINDKEIKAWDYTCIADVYFKQSAPDKGLDYALKAYDIYKVSGDKWGGGISYCLNLLANAYLLKKDFSKAVEYAQLGYERIMIENNVTNISAGALTLGYMYAEDGKYDKALEYNLKAMESATASNQKMNVASAQNNLGILYTRVAQDPTGKWMDGKIFEKTTEANLRRASEYLKKAEPAIVESDDKYLLIENYEAHALALELLGDYRNALTTYKKFRKLKDSLFSQENQSQIRELEVKKEQDLRQKESEITLLKVERTRKERNYLIGGLVLFAALSLSLYYRYRSRKSSEELLLNILPEEVADEIKTTGAAKAKAYTMVTVMFTDFEDFTKVSENVSAELLVNEIHTCFSAFDLIIQRYKIEKIKTIGDAYMCASGLPVSSYTHATDMVAAAIEIRDYMLYRKKEKEAKGETPFELRIGIHTGPVVAGVVGTKKYAYDIWGDTVNIAARMEQNSETGKINISGTTYELVKEKFNCAYRGKIPAKNKGEIDMYFVEEKTG